MPSDLPNIRRVEQRHANGCAVACVAMITGVSYDRARRALKGNKKRDLKADVDEMGSGIRKLGFKCRMGTDFRKRRLPSIIMFEWPSDPGFYHCVVWDPIRQGFIDPGYKTPLPSDYYLKNWKRLGYKALMVTGKR